MKKMILTFLTLFCALPVFAGVSGSEQPELGSLKNLPQFYPGVIALTADGLEPNSSCGTFTQMTLDSSPTVGDFAYFEDMMTATSLCDLYVAPNIRLVKITQIVAIGGGAMEYSGTWEGPNGSVTNVIITDRRTSEELYLGPSVLVEFTSISTGISTPMVLKSFATSAELKILSETPCILDGQVAC